MSPPAVVPVLAVLGAVVALRLRDPADIGAPIDAVIAPSVLGFVVWMERLRARDR